MTRTPTAADGVADRYLDASCALDPLMATYYGVAGHDDQLPDLSPDGHAERSALRQRTLHELADVAAADDIDEVTVAALREELELSEELRAAGADLSDLDVIASPAQNVRDVLDLMSTATADDWGLIVSRLTATPAALAGYTESLRAAARAGNVAAVRQVDRVAEQCAKHAAENGFYAKFARDAALADGPLPDALRPDLERATAAAVAAYTELESFLRTELRPQARAEDPVGAEKYALYSRRFLGARIDLAETYEWGQAEVARIAADKQATAERIKPGLSVEEALDFLENDPARKLHGTDALQAWMQEKSDEAVAALTDTHFDIPEPIRRLECMIAPSNSGGIYYTQPSEDLVTRPGRMWWSVPDGVTSFGTWRELTTVYHEGVPGHHLQVAQTLYRAELLNRWRRVASWISGHGEGWALYAERLMAELGYLSDPGDYLGMLDSSDMRAARVVLDIGVHCGFEAPAEVGGGAWDYEKAWTYLTAHSHMAEEFLRFELDRYLGWPGQAPSYKVGERIWLQLREEVRVREGSEFDLKAFHRRALDIGSVGLDVLRQAVLA